MVNGDRWRAQGVSTPVMCPFSSITPADHYSLSLHLQPLCTETGKQDGSFRNPKTVAEMATSSSMCPCLRNNGRTEIVDAGWSEKRETMK